MTSSRLDMQKPYEHLVGNIDHVVLSGTIDQLRVQDIVLDGMFWVKSLTEGRHDNQEAISIQLAPIEAPGISAGRLTLLKGMSITFARPLEYETWDPHTTDLVTDAEYDESTATETRELLSGDFVGWTDDQYDEDAACRVRQVVAVYPNGLILFKDGAYQSEPNHSWYVLNIDPDMVK